MGLNRPPKSAAEIATLPAFDSTECAQLVRTAGSSFEPETLVYIIREAIRAKRTELVVVAGECLATPGTPPGRARTPVDRALTRTARVFGFMKNPALLDEFCKACLDLMWDGILAGREEKPFWEVNFRHTFRAKCIDAGRPLYHRSRRYVSIESVPNLTQGDPSIVILAQIGIERILEAISRLPPPEARVAMLHWVEKRPVDSPDPGSVARIVGLSPSHVHNLLRNARARLAGDPAIQDLRDAS